MVSPAELAKRGIYNFDTLSQSMAEEQSYVIDGLLTERSINLLAGDSGIGKTPLCITLALAVAAGKPFMGMNVARPRRVLYCDAESHMRSFHGIVERVSQHMGFAKVPDNFHVWSPNWDESQKGNDYAGSLWSHVEWAGLKPEFIIVDPLRIFFPEADLKREVAIKALTNMRRVNGGNSTWLIIHHVRKPSIKEGEKPKPIEDDPFRWFHEVAGQHAIINHVDTRLGVEATPLKADESEMTLAGFVRMQGPISPIYLLRQYDDEGDPIGYVRAQSMDLIHDDYRVAYYNIPNNEGRPFTFTMAKQALNKGDSSTASMLKRLASVGAIKKVKGGYLKLIT